MFVSEIQLFQILKQKLGEKEAEALVEFVDLKLKENNEGNIKILATKEDLANTKVEIIKWLVGLILGLFIALVSALTAIMKLMQ